MKNTNKLDDWRVLCELASREKDPEKLVDLIVKINQALEDCQQKSRYQINTSEYSYCVVPQFSRPAEYDC
jgi:hypothetical protein